MQPVLCTMSIVESLVVNIISWSISHQFQGSDIISGNGPAGDQINTEEIYNITNISGIWFEKWTRNGRGKSYCFRFRIDHFIEVGCLVNFICILKWRQRHKNPIYRRHWLSWPMQIEAPIYIYIFLYHGSFIEVPWKCCGCAVKVPFKCKSQ